MNKTTDKYFPTIFWTILIVLITAGAWFLVTRQEEVAELPVAGENETSNGDVPPVIAHQPVISEVTLDGSVSWTLFMDRITKDEGSVIELASPLAKYYFEETGDRLDVESESGTYDEEAGILILTGGVTGHSESGGLNFQVAEMTWDNGDGTIKAVGGVTVSREGIRMSGSEMIIQMTGGLTHLEVNGGDEKVLITASDDIVLNTEDSD